MKIRIFCDYDTDEGIKEVYINFNNILEDERYNKEYVFTTEEDYTHALILNTVMPKLNIKKENVIGYAQEPLPYLNLSYEFVEYAKENINAYLIGDATGLPKPFIEHHGYMGHLPYPRTIREKKTKFCSIIFSKKYYLYGHKYRHMLVSAILKTNLPIDIYGRGTSLYNTMSDIRIKGEFKEAEPYEDYRYHIAIENIQHPDYMSEKIINPLLYETNVIYWGAKNINKILKKQPIHILKGELEHDMNMIKVIYKMEEKLYKKPDMTELEELKIQKSFKFFGNRREE